MLIFVIAVVIIVVITLFGIVIAFGTARLDTAVKENQAEIENKDKGYSPAVTLGHKVKVEADYETQLKEARLLAAKKAATLPRGANMNIGRLGQSNLQTASDGLQEDPMSAVRIAAFHGWDGARTGFTTYAPVAAAPTAVAAPSTDQIELVPGKDYEIIEISDDMSPDEKRKARIANAKAKSAAMKARKAAVESGVAPAGTPVATAAATSVSAVTMPSDMPDPPQLIEITDEMSPEEIRKARIANSKAKSAYNKALKAAGLSPDGGQATAAAAVDAPTPQPSAPPPAPDTNLPSAAADIPKPDYIEITDDLSPDELRKARIHNAKARSAYNKALKAAGIDPKTVEN